MKSWNQERNSQGESQNGEWPYIEIGIHDVLIISPCVCETHSDSCQGFLFDAAHECFL